MLTSNAYQPGRLPGSLLLSNEIPNLGIGFVLEMLSALILCANGYSAVPLV